ncbi:MAG: C40 family peptidase [Adhaeribacter sp.]
MKLIWIVFIATMVLLGVFGLWQRQVNNEVVASVEPQAYTGKSANGGAAPASDIGDLFPRSAPKLPAYKGKLPRYLLPDSITAYGISLIGTPYLPAGITCEGFDCSGFIHHIFGKYGVELPHASALLISEGKEVPLQEVRKGDLLIFTGPGENRKREPGHVGVVITGKGESPEFVHSSSVGGVKISKVQGTGYEQRFLQARRVLE